MDASIVEELEHCDAVVVGDVLWAALGEGEKADGVVEISGNFFEEDSLFGVGLGVLRINKKT